MPEEEISVDNSADSLMEETPSETTETVVPDEQTPEQPAEPEVELFELPDGRKVDAETLTKEWKDNFAPEFTRRSQELADLKKGTITNDNKPTEKPYADPDWQPQTYAELIEIAKQEVKGDLIKEKEQEIEKEKAIETEVITQLAEIKKADPTLNENALFLHANKYGFRDLKLAHQNMKDMSDVIKKTQKVTADNITKRNDPVSVTPGATGARPDPSQFGNAIEYLRSLQ